MGIINHNAIIATTWDLKLFEKAQQLAKTLPDRAQALFLWGQEVTNGYRSFVFAPDGSKEGWDESDDMDAVRSKIVEFFSRDAYEDGSSSWAWVEVGYGEYGQKVLRGNNQNCYGDAEYAEDPD